MTALRMEANSFLSEAKREDPLRELLLRYTLAVETQLVRAEVCNLTLNDPRGLDSSPTV